MDNRFEKIKSENRISPAFIKFAETSTNYQNLNVPNGIMTKIVMKPNVVLVIGAFGI